MNSAEIGLIFQGVGNFVDAIFIAINQDDVDFLIIVKLLEQVVDEKLVIFNAGINKQ